MSKNTIMEGTAWGRFFLGCGLEERRVRVESNGTILVWDDIAGNFSKHHILTPRAKLRIARVLREKS